ncbi:glucose-6-phosphate dehydrogenase [Actinocorallia sp. A-T 12471]|uniref:glucose-6-phosphate dehydrogenase n=1 Tax=Actinocorallia sp. A-T 12471 TaxID=3089813 RepID=UPI0029CC6260|nr:glucose-6-phosphate dehydrogenase [Actinocorallia sp. A-T 12471]MDX6744829.1 glucose-6-phosphate dehydrogenase [Actinocorallia sp. A-T 12471]
MEGAERRADALVLFGITGDLAAKMVLPALYRLVRDGFDLGRVVGVTRGGKTVDDLRKRARDAVAAQGPVDEDAFAAFAAALRIAAVDYDDPDTFESIAEEIADCGFVAHYLAIPPEQYAKTAQALASAGLNERARLVVEKPFGHDLESARALEEELTRCFPAEEIRRVDHFLGKDAVENLLAFRAANSLIDRALHREAVTSVQVFGIEDLDVQGRGGFYDGTGCLRDVVQNHLLQTLAYFVMETPESGSAEDVVTERARALRAFRTVDPADYVRGQYEGYRETEGVAPDSTTETFAALRLFVDTPRWAGVPFCVQAGKGLATTATEIVVETRRPVPASRHSRDVEKAPPDLLRFRLEPEAGLTVQLLTGRGSKPGDAARTGDRIDLIAASADFPHLTGSNVTAYERVMAAVMTGDPRRFASPRAIEECWRVVAPILDPKDAPFPYAKGSDGPAEAARLTPDGRWYTPG